MARTDPQVNFRIPAELKSSIEAAAAASNRTVTAEIVNRLQASFESRSDPNWQLRVAEYINDARLETLGEHLTLARAHIDRLSKKISEAAVAATPAAVRGLQEELQDAQRELSRLQDKQNDLLNEGVGLEGARREADRDTVKLLERLANTAMQDDLRDLHATEERLGLPADRRGAVALTPEQKKTALVPLVDGLAAYRTILEETLAKRDAQIREWWTKEFGYDPQAPQVEREPNKGPVRSPNARKQPLKK